MNETRYQPSTALISAGTTVAIIVTLGLLYLLEAWLAVELSAHWGLASFPLALVAFFAGWRRYRRVGQVDALVAAPFIGGVGVVFGVIYAIVGLSPGSLWAMAIVVTSMFVFVRALSE